MGNLLAGRMRVYTVHWHASEDGKAFRARIKGYTPLDALLRECPWGCSMRVTRPGEKADCRIGKWRFVVV